MHNTYGILLPKPGAPAAVSPESANPPEPLTNAAGPVAAVAMAADVAASALSIASSDSKAAQTAQAASLALSLASMTPGQPGPIAPSHKALKGFSGGSGGGSDGGQADGSGSCVPCKQAALAGKPVNAVLGIKVLADETELDFAFDAPSALIWQRSYYSDQEGNGWLGQGWSLPYSLRLTRSAEGFTYTDEQGRQIKLPDIDHDDPFGSDNDTHSHSPDTQPLLGAYPVTDDPDDPYGLQDSYYDPYEQIHFSRSGQGYVISSSDGGQRLYFAPVSGTQHYPLVAQADRNGNHIRLSYREDSLPHSLYDSSGRQFRLHFSSVRLNEADSNYDPAAETGVFVAEDGRYYVKRLTSVSLGPNTLVRYDYDGYGDLTTVYDRSGKAVRHFAYRKHIMTAHSQPGGLVSEYTYSDYSTNGKVLSNHTSLGEAWTFDYRDGHTIVTDALGRQETYGYDHNRELIYRIDAAGNRSDSERNDWGRITLSRDELGRETRYLYDIEGNVTGIRAPDGSHTHIDYHDTLKLPASVTDPAGRSTEYAYDERGNLISVTDPAGNTTHYSYNSQGLPESITDPLGKSKTLNYNETGQLITYTDCSGQSTRFGYTAYGELQTITDALGHTTRHHYDAAGNHIRTDYPDGSSEHFEYDHLNRLIAHIDGLGAKTEYRLAPDGLPRQRINALGHTFGYAYDPARRLTQLTNENGDHYRLDYDNTDNLIQETGWDGKITAYGYDAAGQLTQQSEYGQSQDRAELWQVHQFQRNLLGQLIEKQSRRVARSNDKGPTHSKDPGISRTRFDYDPYGSGNLIRARNAHSSIEITYDILDQIVSETTVHNGQSTTVQYSYDPLGNRIQTVLPDGREINSLYYGSGHLHQINLDGDTISDIERDALHREIQRSQGSLSSLYDYDPMGRLKSQTATANPQYGDKRSHLAGGAVKRSYRYDKAGNLIQSTDQRSGVLDYVYDRLGRIESAAHKQTGQTEKFAFDPAHNILSGSPNSNTNRKGRNIGAGNRLKEYDGTEYTHDPLGNLIYRELPNGEKQYFQYDTENQLTRAEIKKPQGNTEIWEYAYDPFGRRLSKERKDKLAWVSTAPKRTHFVWDGTRLLQEYTYKGNYTYLYTDQDSYEPLAQVFYNRKDDKQYLSYYHTDQIGIPREMTDQFGNLLWFGDYTAWGCLKSETKVYQNAHQPFRLQNQYFDAETGLHYNLFRYYEPTTRTLYQPRPY